jgi:2-oxoglutarate ferredoxin oxidoreductase subunit delta
MQIYQQGDYLLILEPALCKGCNLCVKSCPTSILYLSARGKIATTQEAVNQKCIFCRICEMRCPDFAIWVVKPEKSPSDEPLPKGERTMVRRDSK